MNRAAGKAGHYSMISAVRDTLYQLSSTDIVSLVRYTGFESSQIFNLHIFTSGIFGYLQNGKTTCIFYNYSFINRNSEISCCFKGKLTLSSLRLQLY